MTTALDYSTNVYLAVSLTPTSIYHNTPVQIASFPSVSQVGNVGALADVLLLAVSKTDWASGGENILKTLKEDKENVMRVDVQEAKRRVKKGGEHEEL